MIQQAFPTVNEITPSWSDIGITINVDVGQTLETIDYQGVKFASKVEVGAQRGTSGGRVMKRTQGSKTDEASLTMYKSGLRALQKALAEVAPKRGNQVLVSLVTFDVLVQWTPVGETEIYTTKIKGCRLLERSEDAKEGNDAAIVEVGLNPMEIVDVIDGQEVMLL